MNIYRLDNPYGLLFLLLPLIATVILFLQRFVFKKGARLTGGINLKRSFSLLKTGYIFSTVLTLSGLFILAFSLSKPQQGLKKEKIISEGIDIVICMDVSGSMLTPDYDGTTRLEISKEVINEFINKRKGDRIGLVTFSNWSLLRCPATVNFELLTSVIKHITINPYENNGTALGVGLASSINRLLKLKDNEKSSSKIVILVTDGMNNTGSITPEAALEIAKSREIKIYTIAIGRNEEVDIGLLGKIANDTKAKFYHVTTRQAMDLAFQEIDNLEKQKLEVAEYSRFNDVGYKYVILGAILLISGILLNNLFFRRLG